MFGQPQSGYAFDDYLAAERAELEIRHEYLRGEVFAMVGATENHNLIVWNIPNPEDAIPPAVGRAA